MAVSHPTGLSAWASTPAMAVVPKGSGQFVRVTEVKVGLPERVLLLEACRRELLDELASDGLSESRLALVEAEINLISTVLRNFNALVEIDRLLNKDASTDRAEDELLERILVA